jgi:hypothetical protein
VIVESMFVGGMCCVYKRPYHRDKPWQCPECGLLHAVRCDPEPTPDPAGVEEWLAEELRAAHLVPLSRKNQRWRDALVESAIERASGMAVYRMVFRGTWSQT